MSKFTRAEVRLPGFLKLPKFVNSDEGLACVNTIEKIYLGLLVTVFALAIISLFRLSHFRTELRKIFDPRNGFTFFVRIIFFYLESSTFGSMLKDLNGMESNHWKKRTQKNWMICMETIANASSIVISNVLAVSSNVLVDGMKI